MELTCLMRPRPMQQGNLRSNCTRLRLHPNATSCLSNLSEDEFLRSLVCADPTSSLRPRFFGEPGKALIMQGCLASSAYQLSKASLLSRTSGSIIEGVKESLERMQLDYFDVVFAHRCDISGMLTKMRPRFSVDFELPLSSYARDRESLFMGYRSRLRERFTTTSSSVVN